MKKKDLLLTVMQAEDVRRCREHELWYFVLERAVYDYAFFFDWYLATPVKLHNRFFDYDKHMAKELRILEWFLFSKEPEQFNLKWIIDQCFDSDKDLEGCIRRKVKIAHNQNLAKHQENPRLQAFVAKAEKRGTSLSEPPTPSIRKRRHRYGMYH